MTAPVDPFEAMEARRAEQLAEYGTYAAGAQVWVGNTLAYDIGHPIPVSNVLPDGSVVTVRHVCPPPIPGQPLCTVPNNKVMASTESGVAVRVTPDAPAARTAAKKES